jgi:molybdate transport system ATP-binding protein
LTTEIALKHRLGAFTLDAAFQFDTPGVTALFGPSGAGKSTIIHAVAGLIRPERGRIVIGGDTLLDTERGIFVPAHARRLGLVFQDARLFPHLSVRQNLLFGWRRAKHRSGATEIDHVIALLGLSGFLDRQPRTLSGGERSRVALGRALLMQPRALLLDEPLASLDVARKAEILPYLERLRDESRIPILYVSHSLDEVGRLADRIIVLDNGRILADGSVFEVTSRLDLLTGKELFGGTILEAFITGEDEEFALTELAIGGQQLLVPRVDGRTGEKVRVRIDPQDVMLALARPEGVSANNVLAATVVSIHESAGAHADVHLAINGARLTARITRRSVARLRLTPAMTVFAVIKSVTVGGRERA